MIETGILLLRSQLAGESIARGQYPDAGVATAAMVKGNP